VEEHFLLLLALALLVALIDFLQVVTLLFEELLGFLDGIEEVHIPSVFFRFQIQVVKKLHQTLVELSDLDLGRAVLDLPLEHSNVHIEVCDIFPLSKELIVFLVELRIDLSEDFCMFLLLHVFPSLLHLFQFLVKPQLFLLAVFLQLHLLFS